MRNINRHTGRWISHRIVRSHPLDGCSLYQYAGTHVAAGNVHVYKTASKMVSEIISAKLKVPHSKVHYAVADRSGVILFGPTIIAEDSVITIAWVRRHEPEEVTEAVATMLMLNDNVVLVRAFDL